MDSIDSFLPQASDVLIPVFLFLSNIRLSFAFDPEAEWGYEVILCLQHSYLEG